MAEFRRAHTLATRQRPEECAQVRERLLAEHRDLEARRPARDERDHDRGLDPRCGL